jgi:predicted DNA-binding transcriptional regulator
VTSREKVDGEKKQSPKTMAPSKRDALNGTTRRVYRYIYKRGPVRPQDIQRDIGLSSLSLADYHVQKLLGMKLIREEQTRDGSAGYSAEEAVFEAMVRIRRTVIPLRAATSVFFAVGLVMLLTLLRPPFVGSAYAFSVFMIGIALLISVLEMVRGVRNEGL